MLERSSNEVLSSLDCIFTTPCAQSEMIRCWPSVVVLQRSVNPSEDKMRNRGNAVEMEELDGEVAESESEPLTLISLLLSETWEISGSVEM